MTATPSQVRLQVFDKFTNEVIRDLDATGRDFDAFAAEVMRNLDPMRYDSRRVAG